MLLCRGIMTTFTYPCRVNGGAATVFSCTRPRIGKKVLFSFGDILYILYNPHLSPYHTTPPTFILPIPYPYPNCLLFYVLETSKVVSGWVPTCYSAHSCGLYCGASLGNQTISTMTWYPTQSHYSDTEPTSPCPLLMTPNTWLGSDKYQFYVYRSRYHDCTWT